MIDEQKFFAWLDGELPPGEASEVEQAVAADPKLRRKAEAHRAMTANLRNAFEPLLETPVDLPQAKVVSLDQARRDRAGPQWWQQAAAIAATLVVGLMLGSQFVRGPNALAIQEDGRLVASPHLASVLDQNLASEPKVGSARIGLTFRDRQGRICRTFSHDAANGLACNADGSWAVETLVGRAEGQQGEFRMAAGPDPRIATAVEGLIAGEPFDAAQERIARDSGWQAR